MQKDIINIPNYAGLPQEEASKMSKCSYPIETFIKVHLNNGILMKKVGVLGKRKQYKIEMIVFTTRFWSIRLTTFLIYQ